MAGGYAWPVLPSTGSQPPLAELAVCGLKEGWRGGGGGGVLPCRVGMTAPSTFALGKETEEEPQGLPGTLGERESPDWGMGVHELARLNHLAH